MREDKIHEDSDGGCEWDNSDQGVKEDPTIDGGAAREDWAGGPNDGRILGNIVHCARIGRKEESLGSRKSTEGHFEYWWAYGSQMHREHPTTVR